MIPEHLIGLAHASHRLPILCKLNLIIYPLEDSGYEDGYLDEGYIQRKCFENSVVFNVDVNWDFALYVNIINWGYGYAVRNED